MQETAIKIGPRDHGRPMGLDEFQRAEGREGYGYELGRGVIIVVDVPSRRHLAQVDAMRQQFYSYRAAHPGEIHTIAAGGECKLLIRDLQSERHPDLAVYKGAPPDDESLWAAWVPEIVVEVVSPGSEERDYVEKRAEYLAFGVSEYWIIDAAKQQMLVLRRSGEGWTEQVLPTDATYQPKQLPGMTFSCSAVFRAADDAVR